jgi:hypothetical protein
LIPGLHEFKGLLTTRSRRSVAASVDLQPKISRGRYIGEVKRNQNLELSGGKNFISSFMQIDPSVSVVASGSDRSVDMQRSDEENASQLALLVCHAFLNP